MIKRHYFISVQKYHGDGSGSSSYTWKTGFVTSLFPMPEKVFEMMLSDAKKTLEDSPGDGIRVVAFNRI